jgi:hypothetical protein
MCIIREAAQISKIFLYSIAMPIFLGLTYVYYLRNCGNLPARFDLLRSLRVARQLGTYSKDLERF